MLSRDEPVRRLDEQAINTFECKQVPLTCDLYWDRTRRGIRVSKSRRADCESATRRAGSKIAPRFLGGGSLRDVLLGSVRSSTIWRSGLEVAEIASCCNRNRGFELANGAV